MRIERVVIAGAGLAGLRTAEELRRAGHAGSITMLGAEPHPPYDRPPLTKKYMLGQLDDIALAADLDALGVDLRLGERATAVDGLATGGQTAGVVRTEHAEHPFDALVVATGASPVVLPGGGPQRVVRTVDDAAALREALRPGVRLAVVGAGWIGAELATAAASLGCHVVVVEAGPAPLAAALGPDVGAATTPWYDAAGVELLVDQPVAAVEPGGLSFPGGGWLAADVVVTAVGVRPEVGWLASSGLMLDNGVAVDERLRASAPGVYAAGDCAAFLSPRQGRRIRVEHWDNALHAPEVAAANVLGGDKVYDQVPYFWSEQFGRMVQYAGDHRAASRLLWRGDPVERQWSVCWLSPAGDGERLAAVMTVGRPRDLLQGRRLIGTDTRVDPGRLADPDIPLRDAAIG